MPIPKEFCPNVTTPLLFPRGNKAFTGQFIHTGKSQPEYAYFSFKNSYCQKFQSSNGPMGF